MPAGSLGPPSSSSRPGPGPRRQQAPPPRPPAARPSPRVPVPLPPGTAATSARPPEVGTGQPLAPRIPSNRLALARPSAPPPREHGRHPYSFVIPDNVQNHSLPGTPSGHSRLRLRWKACLH
nr:basic proline-rich protein-like [Peromyscus maniculatus bairdii]